MNTSQRTIQLQSGYLIITVLVMEETEAFWHGRQTSSNAPEQKQKHYPPTILPKNVWGLVTESESSAA